MPSSKQLSAASFRRIAEAVLVGAVLVLTLRSVLLSRNDGYLERQLWNMVSAERHIRVLEPKLGAEVRFREVTLSSWTCFDGSLLVDGEVASDADFEDLRRIVAESKPPVTAVLEIRVGTQHQSRTAELHPKETGQK